VAYLKMCFSRTINDTCKSSHRKITLSVNELINTLRAEMVRMDKKERYNYMHSMKSFISELETV
jgi:hypothetical protein